MKKAKSSLLELPRKVLKSLLALDDSPHAIALGIGVGMFVGLTPTVGVQTIIVVSLAALTRRFCYFNVGAACATTYVSNPVTMVPMYYGWYRLGALFVPGYEADVDFDPLVNAETWSAWWTAMVALSTSIGIPMMVGSLLTAVPGGVLAYGFARRMIRKLRRKAQFAEKTPSAEKTQPAESNTVSGASEPLPRSGRVDESHNDSTSDSSAASAQKVTGPVQQTLTT